MKAVPLAPPARSPLAIMPDPRDAEMQQLRRDLASARARCARLWDALRTLLPRATDLPTAPEPFNAYGALRPVSEILRDAKTLEALGQVPVIRFVRDRHGDVCGVELAAIGDPVDSDRGFRMLTALAARHMAVVAG